MCSVAELPTFQAKLGVFFLNDRIDIVDISSVHENIIFHYRYCDPSLVQFGETVLKIFCWVVASWEINF